MSLQQPGTTATYSKPEDLEHIVQFKKKNYLSSLFPPMSFKIRNNTNLRRAWLVEQLATVSVVVVIMVVVTSPCKSCKSSCGRGCCTHAVVFHCYFSLRLNSFRRVQSYLKVFDKMGEAAILQPSLEVMGAGVWTYKGMDGRERLSRDVLEEESLVV